MKKAVIFGSGGHAKVVIDLLVVNGYEVIGIIDRPELAQTELLGYKIIGSDQHLKQLIKTYGIEYGVIAIGNNDIRKKIVNKLARNFVVLNFPSLIHPQAIVAANVKIGEGSLVFAGAVINSGTTVGKFCLLNTKASLDHDSIIRDFSNLAPGVTTGGNVRLGEGSSINIGATVSNNITIGDYSIIGAGATVLNNIDSYSLAYGSPARVIKQLPKPKHK